MMNLGHEEQQQNKTLIERKELYGTFSLKKKNFSFACDI